MDSSDRQFNFIDTPRDWLNNDLFLTHMFDAASIALPYIEGLVNFSVKNALGKIQDKKLYEACIRFIEQETSHSREHIKCNDMLKENGYSFPGFVRTFKKKLTNLKTKWSALSILAIGVGLECLNTVISKTIIDERVLTHTELQIQQFWQWHMLEEIEHRSVLIDLYSHLGGGYFRRVAMLALVLWFYCFYGIKIYFGFLRIDGASFFQGMKCIFGKKSFFIKSLFKSFRSFSYHYHPDQYFGLAR
jgi:uncharacterized protein